MFLTNKEELKQIVVEALHEVMDVPRPFNCDRCPRNSDSARGPWCPAWGTILLTETSPTGASSTNVVEACYFKRQEKWHEGIRQMAAINVESLNEVRKDSSQAVRSVEVILSGLQQMFSAGSGKPLLPGCEGRSQDALECNSGDSKPHGTHNRTSKQTTDPS